MNCKKKRHTETPDGETSEGQLADEMEFFGGNAFGDPFFPEADLFFFDLRKRRKIGLFIFNVEIVAVRRLIDGEQIVCRYPRSALPGNINGKAFVFHGQSERVNMLRIIHVIFENLLFDRLGKGEKERKRRNEAEDEEYPEKKRCVSQQIENGKPEHK